jgi:steroid delta-isomerase-like uncharacterized protein
MSTEENKAVLRRNGKVFNKGDLAVADETIAPNYVYHGLGGMELKGREGFKQVITMMRNAFPDLNLTVEDMVAEGDKVAHHLILRGTHKGELMGIAPTGKQVTISIITISRFVGGKEVEAWSNLDQLGMMQQIGVALPMGQA